MIFILWLIFSFVVAAIAKDKKLGFWGGFFVSVILSPLIGLIIALISKPKDETSNQSQRGQFAGTYDTSNQRSNVTTYKKPRRK